MAIVSRRDAIARRNHWRIALCPKYIVNNLIPIKVKQEKNLIHELLQRFFNVVCFSNKSNTATFNQPTKTTPN